MIYQNLHVVTGNLGHDAELSITAQGRRVLHLRIATEYTYNHSNKTSTTTTWHNVTLWGALAEKASVWRKGDLLHVEGPVFERAGVSTDGSKPRKHRELYADIAYRVDTSSTDTTAPIVAATYRAEDDKDEGNGNDPWAF